jgi:hypothetical protein
MNKHILFLIDHLANPNKYTQAELEANFKSARVVHNTDEATYAASRTAVIASRKATYAAYRADYAAYTIAWVDLYFETTGEDKQTYINALGEQHD